MNLWSRICMLLHVRADAALDRAEDPRQTLDYACDRQRALLREVRQGLVEVATSRRELEVHGQKLRARLPQCEELSRRALAAGREDLARAALQHKQACQAELAELDRQLDEVKDEERKLILAERQCTRRVEALRARRSALSARYTAAEAQARVSEAAGGFTGESAELGAALERAEAKIERMQARALALDALLAEDAAALPPVSRDAVEAELEGLAARQAVEVELAALRAQLQISA